MDKEKIEKIRYIICREANIHPSSCKQEYCKECGFRLPGLHKAIPKIYQLFKREANND